MGWYFGPERGAKQVQEMLLQELRANPRIRVIDYKATSFGRHFWTLIEIVETGERFINFDLITGGRDGWGYKPMDESMGVYYYDCPVALIDAAGETTNETARAWRDRVREVAARMKRKLAPGTRILLYGTEYEVVVLGRTHTIRRIKDGQVYRLTASNLAAVEVIEGYPSTETRPR